MRIFSSSLLFIVGLGLAGCQTTPLAPPADIAVEAAAPLAILQGATDSNTTQINILAEKNRTYTVSVHLEETILQAPVVRRTSRPDSNWEVLNFKLTGLTPEVIYSLKVFDEQGKLVDDRQFKTFVKEFKKPKIAIISCTDDRLADIQKAQWESVWSKKPDMLFMIGDNVYADSEKSGNNHNVTEADLWRRYVETRSSIELYRMKTLIPVFATWDDHDYGANNGDQNFPLKEAAKGIFQTFFPMAPTDTLETGPGVSSYLQLAKQNFVFLDDRSFRTKAGMTPGDSHFGSEQEQWLYQLMKKNKGPFWLISGDQFFGAYHTFESYEGNHPNSFKEFLKKLKERKRTVVFISGDRHLPEVMKIPSSVLGYDTLELTSSGLHAKVFPGSLTNIPNPRALFAKDGEYNYMVVEAQAQKSKLNLETTVYGLESKVMYKKDFEIQQK